MSEDAGRAGRIGAYGKLVEGLWEAVVKCGRNAMLKYGYSVRKMTRISGQRINQMEAFLFKNND